MPTVIAIAGGSASGKSTLAGLLQDACDDAAHVSLDDFYRDEEDVDVSFDHPDSLDWHRLDEDLGELVWGNAAEVPEYSFPKSKRVGTKTVGPADVIIVEGLWALHDVKVREAADVRVFIDTPVDVRLARRVRRDTKNRGCTVEEAIEYFFEAREYEKDYVDPTREYADLIVDGRPTRRTAEVLARLV